MVAALSLKQKPVLKGKELEKGKDKGESGMWVESKADAHCSICLCLAHSCKSPSSLANSLVALGNLLCLSEL